MNAEFKRPIFRNSAHFDWIEGSADPAVAHRITHDTAWALLSRVRREVDAETVQRVINLVDTEGIDDIAELWSEASSRSLAGVLWRLYLIRRVVVTNPSETALTFRLGFNEARTIDPVLVGVASPAEPEAMAALVDEILHGVFTSDFVDALHRASAFCSILSLGFTSVADSRDNVDERHASEMTQRALRYSTFAEDFKVATKMWESGTLH